MGKQSKALLAALAIVSTAGCSTTSTLAQASPRAAPQRYAQDAAYIAQVEKMARKRGVRVHWVNAPLTLH